MDADIKASWICGLWSGVAEQLLAERIASTEKDPLTEPQAQHLRSLVTKAAADAPYLRESADSFLARLEAAR